MTTKSSSSTTIKTAATQSCFIHKQSGLSLTTNRRDFLGSTACTTLTALTVVLPLHPPAVLAAVAAGDDTTVKALVEQIKEARILMDKIPPLIEKEQWDSVRAVLIQPPLIDCWAKTSRPLLPKYAQALGDTETGDELAALEAKEDVISHLRYLDMAVYNNVFNPIKAEGTNGATKELIRSYYEDPTNEWKASVKAFDELIELANN